ncbi:5582_t:CDS:2, partial [Scutellospora calospora]
SNDGCANIHNDYTTKGSRIFNYTDVSNCYKSIQYDVGVANQTIQTLNGIFNGFYPFLDMARNPPPNGFNYSSMNITFELDRLLNKTYGTLVQFMTDVKNVTNQLKDGHTNFVTSCFSTFAFFSNITLYSTIGTNGIQTIKVRNDSIDPSNNDCEVTLIDGIQAFQVIYEFARDSVFISRDIGVRFNIALDDVDADNSFSYRLTLPPTSNITYKLNCNNTVKDITRFWIAMSIPEILNLFNDSNTFLKNRCKISTTNQTLSQRGLNETQSIGIFDITQEYKGDHYYPEKSINITTTRTIPEFISFFKNDSLGFVKIFTEKVILNDTVAINTIKGFEELATSGVKKVVLDLSNNFGGSIAVSAFISLILFPKANPFFDYDFRATKSLEFALDNGVLFNRTEFISTNNDLIGNNSYTRGNITESYSNKFSPNILDLLTSFIAQYLKTPIPWTSNDIIILTNGVCGSACALIAELAAENNVSTVAVGGIANTSLSYFSFPGGFYINSSLILGLNSSNNNLIPKPFPLDAYITLPYTEVYSKILPDQPLEFLYNPAKYRLYYDQDCIQNPSILWSKAVALLK